MKYTVVTLKYEYLVQYDCVLMFYINCMQCNLHHIKKVIDGVIYVTTYIAYYVTILYNNIGYNVVTSKRRSKLLESGYSLSLMSNWHGNLELSHYDAAV